MSIQPLSFTNANTINQINFGNETINPNYTTQPYPQDSVEINGKKKGLSNGQKWGIGLGIAAALTATALLLRGKVGAAQEEVVKLAEHIDFTPAKTTKEAIEFAKTKLGVKNYDSSMPLDVMNWVNEGLTNINNVRKGKAKLFDTIAYVPRDNNSLACLVNDISDPKFGSIFNLNKKTFENIGHYIEKGIKYCLDQKILYKDKDGKLCLYNFYRNGDVSDNLLKGLNKFNENPESFSIIDKIQLYEDYASLGYAIDGFYDAPYSKLEQLLKNEGIQETLLAHSKLPDLKQIEKLSTQQQRNVLVDIVNTCLSSGDNLHLGYPKGDKFRTIYHESGHLEHHLAVGEQKFFEMGTPKQCIENFGKVSDITNDFINSKEKQQIASRVSNYAPKSPLEFVAETYRKLITNSLGANEKIPDDIMNLYREYKGPAV